MTKLSSFFKLLFTLTPIVLVAACSTNSATGRSQFTGLMPASQEASIGAEEHQKILAQYGGEVEDITLKNYVKTVGHKIVPHTERPDVDYTFTLLDSPVVNAFALPGGYVYVTRGILMLANDEAELAGVIAHEIGHVTARHSAERYSTSVLTSIGAGLLSAAVKVDGASQVLGLGANLYLSSYSRDQEREADDLGVRYLARAGYDKGGMARFLKSLEASAALEAKEAGREEQGNAPNYLSTHPVTAERVQLATAAAAKYPDNAANTNRLNYLKAVEGMIVGDSPKQGFQDGNIFVHPEIGFTFAVPQGMKVENTPAAIVIRPQTGTGPVMVFQGGKKDKGQSLEDYLRLTLFKGDMSNVRDFGTNRVNGFKTASGETDGTFNGQPATVRFFTYEWAADRVFQFTIFMPRGTTGAQVETLKNSVMSFQRMTAADKTRYRPKRLSYRVAQPGTSVESLSQGFPYNDGLNAMRFRVINGLWPNDPLTANRAYKVITQ